MTDETRIAPALTPEEWAALRSGQRIERGVGGRGMDAGLGRDSATVVIGATHCGCDIDPEHNHAVAAVCLHGQPYGFTHEDLANLRETLREAHDNGNDWDAPMLTLARQTLDKIAALLPPAPSSEAPQS